MTDRRARGALQAPADVPWRCEPFDALSPRELYAVLAARAAVFVVEQQCPFQDPDGIDESCRHLWHGDAAGNVLAYLRVVPPGVAFAEPSLGRILTTSHARGRGLGAALVAEGLRRVEALYGRAPVRIGAQRYLVPFYQGFGFTPTDRNYDEDGIPHTEMLRP